MQTTTLGYDKVIQLDHIKASFAQIEAGVQEVVLEINSNKFLIRMQAGIQSLLHFEVLAVKGFVELSMRLTRFLKRLVSVLYFEY
ncbi:MAG: hypothetical protein RL023_955 [Candidatus Parcubacteria bacterium]|jgi:hypothetical protein